MTLRTTLFTLLLLSLSGCRKDKQPDAPTEKMVTGTVYKDCAGHALHGQKVYLTHFLLHQGLTILSIDSTVTNREGHFALPFREFKDYDSSPYYGSRLYIPNTYIDIYKPEGYYDLYPNQKYMFAMVKLSFHKAYTDKDTFYYQFQATYDGYLHGPEFFGHIPGPFHDTIVWLNELKVGNINSRNKAEGYCGIFKWGIGKAYLNQNYSGRDGYFELTHVPCTLINTFEYFVKPI